MTAGYGSLFSSISRPVQHNNARHRWILQSLNMNAIPNNIPINMRTSYMWALEYGSMMHGLPKNLAKKIMQYRTPHEIYRRARETRMTKNTHPNLSYNDAFALSHVGPYMPRNVNPREVINSYKSLKRRGLSSENAAMSLLSDPLIGKKHNASNTIKRAWKTFRYGTMLRANKTLANPKFREKMSRHMESANKSYDKYMKKLKFVVGGSPIRRTRMNSLTTELLRKVRKLN